ncbi:helix-turn-helix domain-containing protein [Tissierella sp. MB52-C2]|uniref:helix-turn-helix domain-containing protein n=1 Tax=Tissierella sp. MB52-C2 TaxID=3070999 RepID=UPI00280B143E|nr:helix-turn-helix domain-containing protein [Tissierella sp. MB52-C2]WMM24060.1 helix-turn-helix domain-containing protein [Tissierella sp. MB52-C2]
MDEIRIKAKQDYLEGMRQKDIADKYNISINTLKSWIKRYGWSEEKKNYNKKGAPKKKRGAPLNNTNAVGNDGGAPPGNINAIKHGAYQSLYADMLNTEDKILFNMIQPSINVDDEIRLLRLKIAGLINREKTFFYNMFGIKVEKDISEEDRVSGINACMDQLRKLIETKAKTLGDTEKLQLDKEKFEFNKYKTEIELQLKKENLELEKLRVQGEDEEYEDDGFLEALKGQVSEVWEDAEED